MSAAERIRHEVREIGLATLYFLCCFLFFLSLKALLLHGYAIEVKVLGTAIVGAVVVAKVVVILDKTPLGEWFASEMLLIHVLWRSLVYTLVVFLVTLAEGVFDLYRESGSLMGAVSEWWAGEDLNHFLAMNLSVGFFLLVYNVLTELGRHMQGAHPLRRFFFSRRARAPEAPEGTSAAQ